MGACYSIYFSAGIRDEAAWLKAAKTAIDSLTWGVAWEREPSYTDVEEFLQQLFAAHQDDFTLDVGVVDGVRRFEVNSNFDGSYSWNLVMVLVWRATSKYVTEDSVMDISADSEETEYTPGSFGPLNY